MHCGHAMKQAHYYDKAYVKQMGSLKNPYKFYKIWSLSLQILPNLVTLFFSVLDEADTLLDDTFKDQTIPFLESFSKTPTAESININLGEHTWEKSS